MRRPRPAAAPQAPAGHPQHAASLHGLAGLRQLVACALLVLLSARLPGRLAALVLALFRPSGEALQGVGAAVGMLSLDGFGVICAIYLTHTRLRGVPLLRCYPPQRLIPLSLHFLGLLGGLLTLAPPGGGSLR